MATTFKIIVWCVAIYGTVLVLLHFFQRALIYHPDSFRPEPAAWGVPELSAVGVTTKDGLELLAWWKAPARDGLPIVLYLHGNAGHLGYRAAKVRPYLDKGYGVLLLAWRGYSGNSGRPDETGLYEDGESALRWLAANGVAAGRIVIYGESLGTGVAVVLAAEGAGRALVLEAPFTSLPDVAAVHYPMFPARLMVRDRFDSLSRIGKVRIPVMVVHGERDRVVPVKFGRRLFEQANEPKRGLFIERGDHVNLYEHGTGRAVIEFIEAHGG